MKNDAFILKGKYKPNEILGIVGKMNLIIGMRLHIILFSAIKSVPVIGIVYDPKIEYYLNVLNMPCGGDVRNSSIDCEKIINQIEGIFLGIERYQNILREKTTILIEKAYQNEQLLSTLLDFIRKQKGGA